jgi:aspartate-semialdehyde dehydrogenase
MQIAVIGATGMVGREILQVLHERNFPASEILTVASERSVGSVLETPNQTFKIISMEEAIEKRPALVLFSAGGETSLKFAPEFAENGIRVIDNSSAWRMSPEHKLIVPEINGDILTDQDMIIANPNCSTIQLVMVLNPLHRAYGVKRVVVSTYQSITGTGKKAVVQLENERAGVQGPMAYPYPIDQNCLPHCDVFELEGYTKEEMKLTRETKKIMGDNRIEVTATAVRVPVIGGHSESVNISFEREFDLQDLRRLLNESPGIVLQDNPDVNQYPMPKYSQGRDEVFVGRIRRDFSFPNSLNLWIVADNLRKGAATNAVQIAEKLLEKGIL